MHVHTFDWGRWVPTDDAVICFVRDNDHLLLIEKKRGLGGGKVNGPGGKLEGDEDLLAEGTIVAANGPLYGKVIEVLQAASG